MDRNSDNRARIEEIRKRRAKREREYKRKRIMIRRIVLLVILAVIVLIVTLAVRSCVSGISEKNAQKKAEEEAALTASATTDPNALAGVSANPLIDGLTVDAINQSFYSDSVFFGNTFIETMASYGLIDGADYISRIGLSIEEALNGSSGEASVEYLENDSYDKVFLMFGENEIETDTDGFEENYIDLVKAVKEYQPSAQIYLLSATPVSKTISDAAENGLTNENIIKLNRVIRSVAQTTNVNFADIFNGIADNGYLPEGAASDGIHFGKPYYIKCLSDIQKAFGKSSSSGTSVNSSDNDTDTGNNDTDDEDGDTDMENARGRAAGRNENI